MAGELWNHELHQIVFALKGQFPLVWNQVCACDLFGQPQLDGNIAQLRQVFDDQALAALDNPAR